MLRKKKAQKVEKKVKSARALRKLPKTNCQYNKDSKRCDRTSGKHDSDNCEPYRADKRIKCVKKKSVKAPKKKSVKASKVVIPDKKARARAKVTAIIAEQNKKSPKVRKSPKKKSVKSPVTYTNPLGPADARAARMLKMKEKRAAKKMSPVAKKAPSVKKKSVKAPKKKSVKAPKKACTYNKGTNRCRLTDGQHDDNCDYRAGEKVKCVKKKSAKARKRA